MKKNIHCLLSLLLFMCGSLVAQVNYVTAVLPAVQHLNDAQRHYDAHNYNATLESVDCFLSLNTDHSLRAQGEFLGAAAAFYAGKPDALERLKKYIALYPASADGVEAMLYEAHYYFFKEQYEQAVVAYRRVDMGLLNKTHQADYCYRLALSLLNSGDFAAAKPYFSTLTEVPNSYTKQAGYYLGIILFDEKKYTAARAQFEAAKGYLELSPSAQSFLIEIDFVEQKYDKVIAHSKTLLEEYPELRANAPLLRAIGESYFFVSDDNEANRYLSLYFDAEPSPERNALYAMGVANFRMKQYDVALGWLARVTSENDAMAQNAYLYLGQCYIHTNKLSQARLAFEQAAALDFDITVTEAALYNYALTIYQTAFSPFDESVTVFETFLNRFPKSRYADQINDYLVEVYVTTRNYSTALASIAKIKQPDTKILQAKQRLLYRLGTEFFVNGDIVQAKQSFTNAINLGNYDTEVKADAYFWRAECEYRSDRLPDATANYSSYFATTKNKNSEIYNLALYNLGYCFFKQHAFSNAIDRLSKFVTANTDNVTMKADALNRIGDSYFYNRNFDAATDAYAKAQKMLPNIADYPLYQQAFVQGLQKQYQNKIALLDRLISEYPRSEYVDDALFEKGRAYVLLESDDKAIDAFKQIASQFPESPVARRAGGQLGMIYFNQNKLQQAIDAYKKVIDKYPGSDEARSAALDLKAVYVESGDIAAYTDYVRSLGGMVTFEISEQDSLTYFAAEKALMRGDKLRAEKAFDHYLQSFEEGAFANSAYYYLGTLYADEKRTDDALVAFEKVLKLSNGKHNEEATWRMASIYYDTQQYALSHKYYNNLVVLSTSRERQNDARIWVVRSAQQLELNEDIVAVTNKLLSDATLAPDLSAEMMAARAKSLMHLNQPTLAMNDWKKLSTDTRNQYGAEATYLMAQYLFDTKKSSEAEVILSQFIETGTPYRYWMARAFVLLSDIYIKNNDPFQAKQYLLSLKNNYTENDDIQKMIADRLSKIKN